jgi:uncharacterized membrane protein YgcG
MAAARRNAVAAVPLPAAVAAEWWTRLVPGEYFEVEYSDDNVAHERIALWPVAEGRWVVKTPDGDVMIEDLDGLDPNTGPSVSRPLRRRAGALAALYRFRARLTDRQVRSSIVSGLRLAHGDVEVNDMPVVDSVKAAGGAIVPLSEYLATTRSALLREYFDRPVAGAGALLPVLANVDWGLLVASDSPIDDVWLSVVSGIHTRVGVELQPVVGRDVKFGARVAMVQVGTEWLMAERVKAADAPAFVAKLRASHGDAVDGEGIGGRRIVGKQPPPSGREAEASAAAFAPIGAALGLDVATGSLTPKDGEGSSDDARTLWIDWDAHGERYKAWREVCRESSQEAFPDEHLDGVTTALHMCKAMERQSGDPRRWLSTWLLDKKIDPADRVAHELRSLTDTLYMAGVVDQVNVGGLLSLELVCRRIAVIVEAYATSAKPSWEHAKFYTGAASAEEVIAPALRNYVLKRAKDEHDLFSARSRTAPRGAPGGGGGKGDGGTTDGSGKGGGGKRTGGKGGRTGGHDASPSGES